MHAERRGKDGFKYLKNGWKKDTSSDSCASRFKRSLRRRRTLRPHRRSCDRCHGQESCGACAVGVQTLESRHQGSRDHCALVVQIDSSRPVASCRVAPSSNVQNPSNRLYRLRQTSSSSDDSREGEEAGSISQSNFAGPVKCSARLDGARTTA